MRALVNELLTRRLQAGMFVDVLGWIPTLGHTVDQLVFGDSSRTRPPSAELQGGFAGELAAGFSKISPRWVICAESGCLPGV